MLFWWTAFMPYVKIWNYVLFYGCFSTCSFQHMPQSYKSCYWWPPIWQHCSRKYPHAVFLWQKPKRGRRSLLLYWPLAINLLTKLCLNYKLDQIWKLTVDPWYGRVNLEESHMESLKLEGIAFWGIGFGSDSKLQFLTALNIFSRLGINLTLHGFIISNCWIACSYVL